MSASLRVVGGVAALGGILTLGGCEAQTTVVTPIVLPDAIAASDRAREHLHVVMKRASSFTQKLDVPGGRCPPFDASAPPFAGRIETSKRGFDLSQSAIPTVPEICVAAWFDTNKNGTVDVGDAVGQLAVPYPAQPSKFISSNRYESPAVVLEPVR